MASEYENLKSIVKRLRLSKEQAKEQARKAFRSELERGRPDLALRCAREYALGDDLVTEAATHLVKRLLEDRRYSHALDVVRGFNLAHGGDAVKRALAEGAATAEKGAAGDDAALDALRELRAMLGSAAKVASSHDDAAGKAIAILREATRVRAQDPKVKGRAVLLEGKGDLWLTGDLHGNVENLRRFVALADLDANPDRILVVQEILHARMITADQRDLSFIACLEAVDLVRRYPGRVYFLLGNHDLAFHQNRELVKGGKYLNRFLMKGLAYMYRDRHEEVAEEYKRFIGGMPAAIVAPRAGVFMSHSTPKKPFVPSISLEYLTTTCMEKPVADCTPINALVNGRDYDENVAKEFAARVGCRAMVCGHTPTPKGWRRPNSYHLIIDSQHMHGCLVSFDLATPTTATELQERVQPLIPEAQEVELASGDLM